MINKDIKIIIYLALSLMIIRIIYYLINNCNLYVKILNIIKYITSKYNFNAIDSLYNLI